MAHAVVENLLDALAPIVRTERTHCALPLHLMIARSEVAVGGPRRALAFVIDTLKDLIKASSLLTEHPIFTDHRGEPFPMHVRWRMLNEAAKAGAAFLEQTDERGNPLVSGKKRRLLYDLSRHSQALA